MSQTNYQYSIQNDFPNHRADVESLSREIAESLIVTSLDYVLIDSGVCNIWFVDELIAGEKPILDSVVAAHQGNSFYSYVLWCKTCLKWYETRAADVPSACPVCSGEVDDATDEQFALRGFPVAKEMPSGHYVFNLENASGNRWTRYKQFVMFPSKLESVPSSIDFKNVLFDGAAGLAVEKITRDGFLFSTASIGKGNNWGFGGVEFDWEAKE